MEWEYIYLFYAEGSPLTIDQRDPIDMQRRIKRHYSNLVRRGWLVRDGEVWRLTESGLLALKDERVRRASVVVPNVAVGDDW